MPTQKAWVMASANASWIPWTMAAMNGATAA